MRATEGTVKADNYVTWVFELPMALDCCMGRVEMTSRRRDVLKVEPQGDGGQKVGHKALDLMKEQLREVRVIHGMMDVAIGVPEGVRFRPRARPESK